MRRSFRTARLAVLLTLFVITIVLSSFRCLTTPQRQLDASVLTISVVLTLLYAVLTWFLPQHLKLSIPCRITLTLSLWSWKSSIFVTLAASRRVLSHRLRYLPHFTALVIFSTMATALITAAIGAAEIKRTVDRLAPNRGPLFAHVPDKERFIGAGMSVASDFSLAALAYFMLRPLCSVKNGWLLYLMFVVSLGVAVVRIAVMSVYVNAEKTGGSVEIMQFVMMASEIEIISTVVLACLPGLRAGVRVLRAKGGMGEMERERAEAGDGVIRWSYWSEMDSEGRVEPDEEIMSERERDVEKLTE